MTNAILPLEEDDDLQDFVYDIPVAGSEPVSGVKGPAVRQIHTLKMRKLPRKTKATTLGQLSAVHTHDDSENRKAQVNVPMQDTPLPEASDRTPTAGSCVDASEIKPVADDRDLVAIPTGDMKPAPLPAEEVEDQATGELGAVAPVAVVHEPRVQAEVMPTLAPVMAGSGFPDGFSIRSGDIYFVQTKDDEPEEIFLCSPIRVIDRFRNGLGRDWGRRIGVLNPDGKEVVITVLDSELSASASKLLSCLVGLGLRKGSIKGVAETIRDLLMSWNPPRRLHSTSHQGWADKSCASFVLGEDRIIGNPDVIYLKPSAAGELPRYGAKGTLEDWKHEVASRCVKNPLMMTAVSLAFVGPLLEVLSLQGGGLHLRGRSSRGKTTLLNAAASVWGPPTLVQSWRTTDSALEATAAAANSKLLVLDELGEVKGPALYASVYMLGNGIGRSRSGGFGQERPLLHWRVPLLSSGEISVAAKIAEGGMSIKAGQEVRLIDVAADERLHGAFDDLHGCADGASFAKKISDVTGAFHGTAGPAFVEWLIERRADVPDLVSTVTSGFDRLINLPPSASNDGVIQRAARWFSLIAAAGLLATRAEVTGWQVKDVVTTAAEIFRSWLDNRPDDQAPEVSSSVTRVRDYLEGAIARLPILPKSGQADGSAEGWQDDACFYIPTETWKLIHGGINTKVAARDIDTAGYLIGGEGENRMRKAPATVPGRPRVYTLRKTILSFGKEVPVFRGG